jgi:hypothetical protein
MIPVKNLKYLILLFGLASSIWACRTTQSVTPPPAAPAVPFTPYFDVVPQEDTTSRHECPGLTDQQVRSQLLSGINRLRRQGCDCMGRMMPAVESLKWDEELMGLARAEASKLSQNKVSPVAWQQLPDGSWAAENRGATETSKLLMSMQLQLNQCQGLMGDNFSRLGAAKLGCYWVLVLK